MDFLNLAQRELTADSDLLRSCWTGSTVASQEQYTVMANYHKVQAVFLYRTTADATKILLSPMDILDRDPAKGTGIPDSYYIGGINVSGSNSFYIGLNPIPAISGSQDIEVHGRRIPLTMVSAGQAPEVLPQFQDGLIDGALKQIYERLASTDMRLLPMLDRAQARWMEWKKQAENYSMDPLLDRPLPIRDTMGYTRRWYR